MTPSDLLEFGAPPELIEIWSAQVEQLTEIQEKAVRAGLLDGHQNVLAVAPTSSGKTFIGEVAATKSALSHRRHAIFIVPYRALAEEQFELFRRRYGSLLSVVIATSDHSEHNADIRAGNFNLAVMTYESLIGFIVHDRSILDRCTALIVDEVQVISDPERGPRLEMLLTEALLAPQPPQIVALSASLDDVAGFDRWLNARLVASSERPVPLTEMVCEPSGVAFALEAGDVKTLRLVPVQADRDALLAGLVTVLTAEGKQVLVFRSTVSLVEQTAKRLRDGRTASGLPEALGTRLNELDDSDAIEDLRSCLVSGVGFHTADLTYPERRLVEDAFREGHARALVSTTTLAMGINLPSDVTIIADTRRPIRAAGRWATVDIPVSEYRNAAGRAGRLGMRIAGTSVLLADDARQARQLLDAYAAGTTEPLESQIPRRPFGDVVFDLIATGIARCEADCVNFMASTFAFATFYETIGGGLAAVEAGVSAAVAECLESGLILRDGADLQATQMGVVLAAAGLSLQTSARLAAVVDAAAQGATRKDIVFEVASLREVGSHPWPERVYGVEQDPRPQHTPDAVGTPPDSRLRGLLSGHSLTSDQAAALIRTACLIDWMDGRGIRAITARFRGMGAASARIRDLGRAAAWLLETAATAAALRGASEAADQLRELTLEARYGLPATLAPLARLQVPGISREHLLALYQDERGLTLHDPEAVLDREDDEYQGLLSPLQLVRLRTAILADIEESLRRKKAGHVARAQQTLLPRDLVDGLYSSSGAALEQAVTDALNAVGLSAARVVRQPHGEEDIRIAHSDGTVVVSVTASQDDARPVRWNKAREVLGTGTGLNPINFVCIARPSFESLAQRSAENISREAGSRSILLLPMPVFAEAIVLVAEGKVALAVLGDFLAHHAGHVANGDGIAATGAGA